MKKIFLLLFTLLLGAANAAAWDDAGHKVVSLIAWEKMTPAARQKAIDILMSAPEDSDIVTLLSADARPLPMREREFFAAVSTWADIIRDREHFPKRWEAYHRGKWHYTNIFWRQNSGAAQIVSELQPETENIVERLYLFEKTLGDETRPKTERAVALAWFLHLVGDIHNPLHNSARVTDAEAKGDQGGNLFEITPKDTPRERRDNLHWYWDSILTRSFPRAADACDAVYMPRLSTLLMKKYDTRGELKIGDYEAWSREGFETATKDVYPADLMRFETPNKRYQNQTSKIASEKLTLAGNRLAAALNKILGK